MSSTPEELSFWPTYCGSACLQKAKPKMLPAQINDLKHVDSSSPRSNCPQEEKNNAYDKALSKIIELQRSLKIRDGGLLGALIFQFNRYKTEKDKDGFFKAHGEDLIGLVPKANALAAFAKLPPIEEVKFGTELTFTSASIYGVRPASSSGQQNSKAFANAESLISEWQKRVETHLSASRDGVEISKEFVNGKLGKGKVARYNYKKKGAEIWWWQLDIDYECIELQTRPSSLMEIRGVKIPIERDIFTTAADLGLAADPKIGGGHISVDSKTAFQDIADIFVQVLINCEVQRDRWDARFGTNLREWQISSAWIHELHENENTKMPAINSFKNILCEIYYSLDRDICSAAIRLAVPSFHNQVLEEASANIKDIDEKFQATYLSDLRDIRRDFLHNRAVNIEHMRASGPEARVEFRRIKAQKDFNTLIDDIKYIYDIIEEAREQVHRTLQYELLEKPN